MAYEQYSNPSLELLFLKNKKGAAGPSLRDAQVQVYGANAIAYFAAGSGLPASASLSDHKLAYYRAQVGVPAGLSIADSSRAYWVAQAP
jgi:hypothetical protein